jgi:hypothetical protein
MKTLLLAAALIAPAASAQMTAPVAAPSVRELRDAFVEAVDTGKKRQALARLAETAPQSLGDVEALYDLFMRFPDETVRSSALDSLNRLTPAAQAAEPLVLRYIAQEEPESVLFGIKAAVRLRSTAALPAIRKIAQRKFAQARADEAARPSDRNAWWAQYEALAALAQLEGEKALPLLEKKAKEAPPVARLIAMYLWPEALPKVAAWSGGGAREQAMAAAALDAPIPLSALRATREKMLALVRDPKSPPELRHQLALRAGSSSTPEEVGALVKEQDSAADPALKRLLAAAIFASRDSQAAPLLLKYAKEDPQPGVRAGARVQLRDMLPPADYRALVEWASKSDPDPENRAAAARELSGLPQPKN